MLHFVIKMVIHVWLILLKNAVGVQPVAQSVRKTQFEWMRMKKVFFILLLTLRDVYNATVA